MKNAKKWTLYFDESVNSEENSYFIGGFLLRDDKLTKLTKILRQLKNEKSIEYSKEIKGTKLKHKDFVPFIQKIQLINKRHCQVIVWNETISDSYIKDYHHGSMPSVWRRLYTSAISSMLMNEKIFEKISNWSNLKIECDKLQGISDNDLKKILVSKNINIESVKSFNSEHNQALQIADIIVNSFKKITGHKQSHYSENKKRIYKEIFDESIYIKK